MGGTWDPDPDGFLLRVYFILWGMCPCGPVSPPPPLEWLSFPPLVAAVLIAPKGAESPGSGRIRVIGALVFFPSEAVLDKLRSPWPPSSTIRHRDVVEYSEVADSVHVGT